MALPRKKSAPAPRSDCAVGRCLDILGDRWTLLVIRDLFLNETRTFTQLMASEEQIPSNILTDRLKRLLREELIEKVPYQSNPPRYEYRLSEKGRTLRPVLLAMAKWGAEHLGGSMRRR